MSIAKTLQQDTIEFIPLDRIQPNSWNPNELLGEQREALKADMRAGGALAIDPILIRPIGREERTVQPLYEIVDGESRWEIAGELKWRSIRSIVREMTEDQAKILCYRKNRERGTINPLKEAKLFSDEMAKGLSQEKIADKYGVVQQQVSERLHLLLLPTPVQELVTTRVVKPSHAEVIAKISDPEKQVEVAKRAAEEELSVRETEDLAREAAGKEPVKPHGPVLEKQPKPVGDKMDVGEFLCPHCHGNYRILCQDGKHSFQEVKTIAGDAK
jgi:ParB family chromosome partitioning protein